MARKFDYNNVPTDDNGIVWDLRLIYAVDIVGQILKDIKTARNLNEFSTWFKLLKRDLATEINHKLAPEEREELKELIDKTKKIINDNPTAYIGEDSSPEEVENIEIALCDLEKFLKILMEQHGMFGQKELDIGL